MKHKRRYLLIWNFYSSASFKIISLIQKHYFQKILNCVLCGILIHDVILGKVKNQRNRFRSRIRDDTWRRWQLRGTHIWHFSKKMKSAFHIFNYNSIRHVPWRILKDPSLKRNEKAFTLLKNGVGCSWSRECSFHKSSTTGLRLMSTTCFTTMTSHFKIQNELCFYIIW